MIRSEEHPRVGPVLGPLLQLERQGGVEVHQRVDLRLWTALRIGGHADVLVRCHRRSAVSDVVDLLATYGVPWLVMGGGSRLVPPDAGLRVPVLLPAGELADWTVLDNGATAGGGANLARVAAAMARRGLRLDPGVVASSSTVGGAAAAWLASGWAESTGPAGSPFEWIEVQRPGRPPTRLEDGAARLPEPGGRRGVVLEAGVRGVAGAAGNRRPVPVPSAPDRSVVPSAVTTSSGRPVAECLGVDPQWRTVAGSCRLSADGSLRLGDRRRASDLLELIRRARSSADSRWGTLVDTRLCFVDELGRKVEP